MKSPRFSSHLFRASEKGASLVEYSLLVAFIALVAWAAIAAVGDETSATFEAAAASIGGISGDGVEAGGPVGVGGESAGSGTLADSDEDGSDALGGAGGAPAGDSDANGDLDDGHGNGTGNADPGASSDGDDTAGGDRTAGSGPAGAVETSTDPWVGSVDGGDDEDGSDDRTDDEDATGGIGPDEDTDGSSGGGSIGDGDSSMDGTGSSGNDIAESDQSRGFTGLSTSGTGGGFYWSDHHGNQGQWTADFTYTNSTDRHQYLDIRVTRTYADGATDSYLVHGHYVPAHGSSKLTVWHNDYRVGGSDQPTGSSVVKVEATVQEVTTSDRNWQPYSTPTDGPAMEVEVPPRP